MPSAPPQTPRIVQLAEQITADIRRRRLKPGDSYLTTAETARLLGISTTAANRAMQLLVQRQVLHRRQRAGTTVAAPTETRQGPALRRVHLLFHRRYLETEGLLADGRVIGIQSELPGADIQFSFPPEGGELPHVEDVIRRALAAPSPEGIVASRASLEVQRALAASGLPVVLAGTAFPSVQGLPWIDRDHCQIGRVLTEHLLASGARWLAVFNRERMLAGDHQTFDAVRDVLAEAGLPGNALTLRCLPYDAEAVATEVRLLMESNRAKGGILCRGTPLADAVTATLAEVRPAQRPALAVCDVFAKSGPSPYVTASPLLGPQEWGARLGRLLARQARGEVLQPHHEIVPVALELPRA